MNRKIPTTLTLILAAGLFMIFSGCNSGSKNKTEATVEKNNQVKIEGVFEYLPPIQGYSIFFDDKILMMYGYSDSTMTCDAGTAICSRDTFTTKLLFSTNPDLVGYTFKWKAEMLTGDTIQVTLINEDGSTRGVVKSIRKVDASKKLKSQMKTFEGFFEYLPPLAGRAVMLGGYYIFSAKSENGNSMAHAGTYTYNKDTITNTQHFLLQPGQTRTFRWVEAIKGDTLNWKVINDAGEITQQGNSLKIK